MTREMVVVLGDVVDSRKIQNREGFQEELDEILRDINDQRSNELSADFEIIKGIDEIGGVLTSPELVYQIQQEIAERIHPESIRLVAVHGRVDIGTDENSISKMDGPAFAKADQLLSSIEKRGFLFDMNVREDAYEDLLVDEINLITFVKSRWTERQMKIARLYRDLGVQTDVAEQLSISQQAVSKTLREARIKQILSIEDRINDALHSPNIGEVG